MYLRQILYWIAERYKGHYKKNMGIANFILAVAIGIVVLSLLVFVHEFGHFIAAKLCKFKVLAFAVGFGKPLWKYKRGDTEYRLNSIPFGGYVAMAGAAGEGEGDSADPASGETPAPKEDIVGAGDSSKPIWQRALVALAGPVANFIFAVATLWVMFIYGVDRPAFMDSTKIGAVISNSAADSAGFLPGDSIEAINGEIVSTWEQVETRLAQQLKHYNITLWRSSKVIDLDLNIERTGARLSAAPTGGLLPARFPPVIGAVSPGSSADKTLAAGDTILSLNGIAVASFDQFALAMRGYDPESGPVAVDVKRGGEPLSFELAPKYDSAENRYLIGLQPAAGPTRVIRYGPIAAIGPTMKKSWEYTVMIFDVLAKLTSGDVSANQLAGPLNIIPVSGLMALQGLSNILNFMALIGVNLAVLNLMPLVITDGGLLVFLAIEAVRRKPLPVPVQAIINRIFIALFLALFAFVSFNDIQRFPDIFKIFR